MSVSNYDRHGVENLKHDHVKPLDRLKIPPWLLYGTVFFFIVWIGVYREMHEEMDLEKMQRRNMLLAMKQTLDEKDLEKETSPSEEHEMKSFQY